MPSTTKTVDLAPAKTSKMAVSDPGFDTSYLVTQEGTELGVASRRGKAWHIRMADPAALYLPQPFKTLADARQMLTTVERGVEDEPGYLGKMTVAEAAESVVPGAYNFNFPEDTGTSLTKESLVASAGPLPVMAGPNMRAEVEEREAQVSTGFFPVPSSLINRDDLEALQKSTTSVVQLEPKNVSRFKGFFRRKNR